MGRKIIIWFVIFTVLLLIVPFFWGTYNRLIKREENVKMAWSPSRKSIPAASRSDNELG